MLFFVPAGSRRLGFVWLVLILAFCAQVRNVRSETFRASWYGSEMHSRTASGEPWRPWRKSVAHRSLPFGTLLRVTYHGRSAICPVNDRGPAVRTGRQFDLSRGCARAIGMERAGTGLVEIERLN
jgi:rare lipoprotein A